MPSLRNLQMQAIASIAITLVFLSSDPLSVPSLMVGRVTNSIVEY